MRPSSQTTRELNGTTTEVLLQNFADRALVLVTQLGKVGNLIQASIPFTTILPAVHHPTGSNDLALPPVPSAIELTTLLGNTVSEHMQTLHSLYAAQIATIIWNWEDEHSPGLRRSVVVGIALRKIDEQDEVSEREIFFQIMEMVQKLLRDG